LNLVVDLVVVDDGALDMSATVVDAR